MPLNPFAVPVGAVRGAKTAVTKLRGGTAGAVAKAQGALAVSAKNQLADVLRRAQSTGGSGDPGATGEPTSGFPIPPPTTVVGSQPTPVRPPTPEQQGVPMPFSPLVGASNPFLGGPTGLEGITVGPGGIGVTGTIGGIPITGTIPLGGGSEAPPQQQLVPGTTSDCPGVFSVRDPVTGNCVDLTALPPGGDPAVTGPVLSAPQADGFGAAVKGVFGVGIVPRVEVQAVRRCPAGMALGKDGVCYDGLSRNSPKRAWPMGMKPLLTPGERRAIKVAASAAGKLKRAQKGLKKAGRALEKVC